MSDPTDMTGVPDRPDDGLAEDLSATLSEDLPTGMRVGEPAGDVGDSVEGDPGAADTVDDTDTAADGEPLEGTTGGLA